MTLQYLLIGFGGIIGCLFAGLVTEYHHPKWVFFAYSFVGLINAYFACRLTKNCEIEKQGTFIQCETVDSISFSEERYEFSVRQERVAMDLNRNEVLAEVPQR